MIIKKEINKTLKNITRLLDFILLKYNHYLFCIIFAFESIGTKY